MADTGSNEVLFVSDGILGGVPLRDIESTGNLFAQAFPEHCHRAWRAQRQRDPNDPCQVRIESANVFLKTFASLCTSHGRCKEELLSAWALRSRWMEDSAQKFEGCESVVTHLVFP